MSYDAIIIGVGGMGSATLFHLANSGCKVLGLEQFDVPHEFGSSHGSTRIIRLAYSEGDEYVPLLRSAYEYWRELESVSGESILHLTGGLDIGPAGSWTIEGSRQSCMTHGLDYEELDGAEITRRFPGYQLPRDLQAIFHRQGGYLLSELAVETYAAMAQERGAELHQNERVLAWERHGPELEVETDGGRYRTARLVITAGPWVGTLVEPLRRLCQPERQVLLWTQPFEESLFEPDVFPVFNMETPTGRYYGFPNHEREGFKIGRYHHLEQQVDNLANVDRECHPADEDALRLGIRNYFPAANGATLKMKTCLFTNSPHEDFILDKYPEEAGVFVAAGFSGHGFKFCSAIGKIMADFCCGETPAWDLGRFTVARAEAASRRA